MAFVVPSLTFLDFLNSQLHYKQQELVNNAAPVKSKHAVIHLPNSDSKSVTWQQFFQVKKTRQFF